MKYLSRLNVSPMRIALLQIFLVFGLLLAIYGNTLMPGTVGGDAGEIQSTAPLLGLVHPTGQPIYILLGKLWTLVLPFKSSAYELNLLAGVSSASAGTAIAWYLVRLYEYRAPWLAGFTGLLFGIGGTIWGQAVLADKYAFTAFLAALIVGATLLWDNQRNTLRADRYLYILCIIFSLGLLHHRSLFLFGVGIAILVIYNLGQTLWQNWRRTVYCLALTLLPPLLIYPTILPLFRANDTGVYQWHPSSLVDWQEYFLERHVIDNEVLVFDNSDNIETQLKIYWDTILADYTWVVVIGALLGIFLLAKQRFSTALFLVTSFVLLSILSANFRGNDRQFTYYVPSFVVMAYAFGIGLYEILLQLSSMSNRKLFYGLHTGIVILLIGLGIFQFQQIYPDMKQASQYGEPLGIWRSTLKSGDMGERLTAKMDDLPRDAVLALDWEQMTIFWYEQKVEGVREDLTLDYPIEFYANYIDNDQPVCIGRNIPLDEKWKLTNIGPIVCLSEEYTTTLPNGAVSINKPLYDNNDNSVLALAGVDPLAPMYGAGQHVPLLLYWQALADIDADYSISIRLLTENWETVWSRDMQAPVLGLYRTSRWSIDEVVGDYHEISIPRDLTEGRYLWTVVVYRALATGEFENLHDSEGNNVILGGTFEVTN